MEVTHIVLTVVVGLVLGWLFTFLAAFLIGYGFTIGKNLATPDETDD